MAAPPVICEHCGFIWQSNMNLQGNATITMVDCTTRCPSCKLKTRMIDGKFSVKNGVINFDGGPSISEIKLDAIKRILEENSTLDEPSLEKLIETETGEKQFISRLRKWAIKIGVGGVAAAGFLGDVESVAAFIERVLDAFR